VTHYWTRGSRAAVRGIIQGRVQIVQSVIVERDAADESVVLLLPGAQCAFPDWYANKKDDGPSFQSRWEAALRGSWNLQTVAWSTNRFLMITRPENYYSVYLIWNHESDQFAGFYVNFQLPYTRSRCGFDTYDLELDIVVDPDRKWKLKDEAAYAEGIRRGVIKKEWADMVAMEKEAVIAAIERRDYPFNNHWLHYAVDPSWKPPGLPQGWDTP
jgi:protein associated with RNAse G/E